MRCLIVFLYICLQMGVVWASTSAAPGTCNSVCTCNGEEDGSSAMSKQEGLAAAVGVLTPMVLGGAGLGLYKLIKGAGPSLGGSVGTPDISSQRGSIPSFKNSPLPSSYHGQRRGSTPVSLFGEDDDISFDDTPATPRLGTSSAYTNIHRPSKGDAINHWM